ncbi:hypothetical protein BDZ91DRAFT_780431 [Kalaharituber pfeilii]|nr:hypothetical protein BDZ91DRAFT_780431 [Kalaharituber pfeilii]
MPSSSSSPSPSFLHSLQSWATPHLESLLPLPLDSDSLSQIINNAAMSHGGPEGAGRSLKELLGDSPDAITFIAEFTARMVGSSSGGGGNSSVEARHGIPITTPAPSSSSSTKQSQPAWSISPSVSATKRKPVRGRGGGGFSYKHEPRKVDDGLLVGVGSGAEGSGLKVYRKEDVKEDDNYHIGKKGSDTGGAAPNTAGTGGVTATVTHPSGKQVPGSAATTTSTMTTVTGATEERRAGKSHNIQRPKPQKQQGILISDLLSAPSPSPRKSKSPSNSSSAKIHIPATTSHLRAPNTGLTDLESALRALELTTNPTLMSGSPKRSSCNCMATRHELLLAVPNCLSCGKIICIKEGPGPCTFCGTPLLNSQETQEMISFLREERGREKMRMDNRANRKAEVARTAKPYSGSSGAGAAPPQLGNGYGIPADADEDVDEEAAALARARAHRDKLLGFQANNAQRTRIIDEAADFDTSAVASGGYGGLNMWATPQERALQLKKQQRRMREIEWGAKDAWEKRKVVVSIDISGKGKAVVRREMKDVEFEEQQLSEGEEVEEEVWNAAGGEAEEAGGVGSRTGQGTYAKNPLLKGLIRPVFTPPKPKNAKGKHKAKACLPAAGIGRAKPLPKLVVGGDNDYSQDSIDNDGDGDEDYEDDLEDVDIPDVIKKRMREAKVSGKGKGNQRERQTERGESAWRRVLQDDQDMAGNERWILDGELGGRGGGGAGEGIVMREIGGEEPGCG